MAKLRLKPFVPKEIDDQIAIFEWAKLMEYRHPALKLLHSTLNGIRLPIGLAVKAKKAGNKIGCPDIYLDVPTHHPDGNIKFCGLRIELKRRIQGHVSDGQSWWMGQLRMYGYCVAVAHGADEAIHEIRAYLGI